MDQRTLPIGPEEAFVLSRVDGRTTQADIASATGLGDKTVGAVLDRLADLGAIQFQAEGAPEAPREASARPDAKRRNGAGGKLKRPVVESTEVRRFDELESAALYDPAELDEECDLDLQRKRTILDLFYRLDQLDHYALLELSSDAEKRDVKAAYFKHVGYFHPDRYFGKNVGTFKQKLEKVFARLTEAHDTLTRKKTRQEYDEYLATRRRNRALERALYGEQDHRSELERARERIQRDARVAEHTNRFGSPARSQKPQRADPRVDDDQPAEMREERVSWPDPRTGLEAATTSTRDSKEPTAPKRPSQPPPEPPRASEPPRAEEDRPSALPEETREHRSRPSVAPPPDPEARRRAFARRMGRGSPSVPPPAQSNPAPAPRHPSEVRRQVADDLKRMYSTRVRGARDNQVRTYLESAEEALREDNPVSAANALRVAASLAPDNEEVRERLDEVEQQANSKLASNYLDQAQYEEKEQHWELAARSYLRAALGTPTARIHERVAHCLLKADGDMKLASEHGKKAVNLAPNQASMRVTLAEVYLKAGMRQSAIAEFERAQALAPHDDTIKDWLKRIRRNQV